MKHLHVACAIIEQEGAVLAARRSASMSLPLKWEFPGGKIEAEETPHACLDRELFEELGITVSIGTQLSPATHDYDDFTVTLYPFICSMDSTGAITLHEHEEICWSHPWQLKELDWAAADLPVIDAYLAQLPATYGGVSR
jgi:8-oxo-dGTP diphosphatase